jgi:hypothetical protein
LEDTVKYVLIATAILLGGALAAVAANAQLLRDSPQNLGDVPGNGADALPNCQTETLPNIAALRFSRQDRSCRGSIFNGMNRSVVQND